MKENENILEKAVKALKNEQAPPGPPRELTDTTIAKITQVSGQQNTVKLDKRNRFIERLKATNSLTKVAAAAVLLIIDSQPHEGRMPNSFKLPSSQLFVRICLTR